MKVKKEEIRTNNITDKKTKRDTIECNHNNMVDSSLKMMIPNMISMEICRVDFSLHNIATAIHIKAIDRCVTQTLNRKMPPIAMRKP